VGRRHEGGEKMEFKHVPVLLHEVLDGLAIKPEGIYVDGTVGGAGHACEIAKRLQGSGMLIGLDRDPDAVTVARTRLAAYPAKVFHCNYDEMRRVLDELEIPAVDGILMFWGFLPTSWIQVPVAFPIMWMRPLICA
jgi:16S rRNA (cytosine1402-N4)-methyltransferase